jgi:short-chain Z-isoprenyl diphosphate synthase
MLWQGVGSELYFCDAYWPGFRHVDFLRALREFSRRRNDS